MLIDEHCVTDTVSGSYRKTVWKLYSESENKVG